MSAKVTTAVRLRVLANREDPMDPQFGDRTPVEQLRTERAHIALGDVVGPLLDDLHDAFDADDRTAMVSLCTKIAAAAVADQRPYLVAL